MSRYDQLLSSAKSDPEHANFAALRKAYTETDNYNPYSRADNGALQKALTENNWQEAVDAAHSLLEKNYLEIQTHLYANHAYTQLGIEAKSTYHLAWGKGLLDSVFASGDGRSFDTAFHVIDTAEEYAFLMVIGGMLQQQSLRHHNEHSFDVLAVKLPRLDNPVEIFFNIDIPMRWLERNAGKA